MCRFSEGCSQNFTLNLVIVDTDYIPVFPQGENQYINPYLLAVTAASWKGARAEIPDTRNTCCGDVRSVRGGDTCIGVTGHISPFPLAEKPGPISPPEVDCASFNLRQIQLLSKNLRTRPMTTHISIRAPLSHLYIIRPSSYALI